MQINLLGAWVDPVSQEEALDLMLGWCKSRSRQYVVTPNLDHCRILRQNGEFTAAYEQSGLAIADGWPLVAASRITKYPIKRRVTGSDLIIPFCRSLARNGCSVFLLGSSPKVLKVSAERLREAAPGLLISGSYSPPLGFENDKNEIEAINRLITEAKPHAVIVALGAPKQELWMRAQVPRLPIGVAIGVGGTLDFLAGEQRRAPRIIQSFGLEWLWRALSRPRRLGPRYLACLGLLPLLFIEHLRQHLIAKENTIRRKLSHA